MRRLIIDTDTGSDDAWAIVEALRASEQVKVEAITVVCGNFPLDLCVKNALLAAEAAGTYVPPVYRGMERPLLEERLFSAENVHGADGLGGMDLPPSSRCPEDGHAAEAIISLVMAHPGEIEIVTCGPLTNLAMAVLLEPKLAENIRCAWILGGSAEAAGNLTEAAEYNVGTDPEAAHIVLHSGMNAVWVTWDTARGATEITPGEVSELLESGSGAARFCALCTRDLAAYYRRKYGKDTFGVIDSMVMTAALCPEIMEECFAAECAVELSDPGSRGRLYVSRLDSGSRKPVFSDGKGGGSRDPLFPGQEDRLPKGSVWICTRVCAAGYKRKMFSLLMGQHGGHIGI